MREIVNWIWVGMVSAVWTSSEIPGGKRSKDKQSGGRIHFLKAGVEGPSLGDYISWVPGVSGLTRWAPVGPGEPCAGLCDSVRWISSGTPWIVSCQCKGSLELQPPKSLYSDVMVGLHCVQKRMKRNCVCMFFVVLWECKTRNGKLITKNASYVHNL